MMGGVSFGNYYFLLYHRFQVSLVLVYEIGVDYDDDNGHDVGTIHDVRGGYYVDYTASYVNCLMMDDVFYHVCKNFKD